MNYSPCGITQPILKDIHDLQLDRGSLLHFVLLPALRGVRRHDVVGQVVEEEHEAGRGVRNQSGK